MPHRAGECKASARRTVAPRRISWNTQAGPAVLTPSGSGTAAATKGYGDQSMLKWAIIFLVISLVAGALGFSGISSAAGRIAKILFAVFLAIFIILLILAITAGEVIF